MKQTFENLRAVLLARCSTQGQTELSIDQQITQMLLFCQQRDIEVVGEIRLEGVSGLDPHARQDVDDLIKRKVTSADFDLVIVASVDRLTRGGVKHGFWIAWELENVGLRITSVCGKYPEDDDDWCKLGIALHEANTDVWKMTRRLQRGMIASIIDGRNPHTSCIPYAIDRLYMLADETQLHRIRNLADGTQIMLAANDETVLRTFAKPERKKKSPHYRRQNHEWVTFVAGDPRCVSVVQRIFRMRFVNNWKGYKIARVLNFEQIPAPQGGLWHSETVKQVYNNSTYTGLGISCRKSNARVGMRSKTLELEPAPPTTRIGREGQRLKSKKFYNRSPDDFLPVEYPYLYGLLDLEPAIIAEIRAFQRKIYEDAGKEKPPKANGRKSGGNPHDGVSLYPLSGIFTVKGTGDRMRGHRRDQKRYYISSRAEQTPGPQFQSRYVAADAIDVAVLNAVADSLTNGSAITDLVRSTLISLNETRLAITRPDRKTLLARRDKLLRDIGVISKANAELGVQAVRALTSDQKLELQSVEADLKKLDQPDALPFDVEAQVTRVMKFLGDLGTLMRTEKSTIGAVGNILRTLIKSLTIEMTTSLIELHLYVPSWCLTEDQVNETVCLVGIKSAFDGDKAHDSPWIDLGRYAGVLGVGRRSHPATLVLHRIATRQIVEETK
jgi:DNA invertase Pin-like site-specific DNA recombinase